MNKVKIPAWFWVVAVVAVLWNLMGLMSFFMHVFMPEEAIAKLAENERDLYDQYPLWTNIVFAIATFGGFAASIGLILRKKWTKMLFIISLLAIIPQMIHNVFFTTSVDVYGIAQAVTMPALVVVLAIFFVWFTAFAEKKSLIK